MAKILAPIKQRILQFIDYKGVGKGYFFEKLETSATMQPYTHHSTYTAALYIVLLLWWA